VLAPGDDSENGRRPLPPPVTGDFIRRSSTHRTTSSDSQWSRIQAVLVSVVESGYYVNLMAFVVLLDAYCTCRDIDARAALTGESEAPLSAFSVISDLCLLLYSVELVLALLVRGRAGFKDPVVQLDIVVVICGYVELVVKVFTSGNFSVRLNVMRVLRMVRIIRLMRLLKKIRWLRELFKLVTMMSTCFKTLMWSFLFCFLVMTGWAMLIVEYVHPLVTQMHAERGLFEECEWCQRATGSVMDANLLLFKTVVAGDSWGQIAVPVIQAHPETAFIFVGSSLSLVFGVLNLIVAVVVDTFAEARANEFDELAEELDTEEYHDRKELQQLFDRIDREGNGRLSLNDLIEGAHSDPALQSRLRVMDIDEHDLQQLFQMIDTDGSGYIEASEFIGPLSRWIHDSKTAPRFIKYNMMQSLQLQEEIYDLSALHFGRIAVQLEEMSRSLQKLHPTPPGPKPLVPDPPKTEPGSDMEISSTSSLQSMTTDALEADLRCMAKRLEAWSMSDRAGEVDARLKEAMDRVERLLISADPPSRLSRGSSCAVPIFGDRVRSLFKQMYVDGPEDKGSPTEFAFGRGANASLPISEVKPEGGTKQTASQSLWAMRHSSPVRPLGKAKTTETRAGRRRPSVQAKSRTRDV